MQMAVTLLTLFCKMENTANVSDDNKRTDHLLWEAISKQWPERVVPKEFILTLSRHVGPKFICYLAPLKSVDLPKKGIWLMCPQSLALCKTVHLVKLHWCSKIKPNLWADFSLFAFFLISSTTKTAQLCLGIFVKISNRPPLDSLNLFSVHSLVMFQQTGRNCHWSSKV